MNKTATCHIKPKLKTASNLKRCQQIPHIRSVNVHGKSFPKQIFLTISILLFLNATSHLNLPPAHLYCYPAAHCGNTGGSRHLVSVTTHMSTHLIGLLKRGICYLLIKSKELGRFPDRRSLKHVHTIHAGFIIRKLLPKHWELAFGTDQRCEGGKWGMEPRGRILRSNDTPGLPLSRCSANLLSAPGYDWENSFLAIFEPSII